MTTHTKTPDFKAQGADKSGLIVSNAVFQSMNNGKQTKLHDSVLALLDKVNSQQKELLKLRREKAQLRKALGLNKSLATYGLELVGIVMLIGFIIQVSQL